MTSKRPSKPKFILHLEVQPRPGHDDNGYRRVALALKWLLRTLGLKCIAVERVKDEPPK